MTMQRAWRLRSRPDGEIADTDLELVEQALPELQDGEILVDVSYISMDPTNRIWMSDEEQYMPPVAIGDIMRAGVAGTVTASRNPNFEVGALVAGLGGYASHIVSDGSDFGPLADVPGLPLPKLFGSLGGTALTAYFGLLRVGEPKPGETVVVSAAAGAVGSIVGQIAKIKGCRAVGIAGGPEKCSYVVDELGFDACVDYKNGSVRDQLDAYCPDGIDVNFENVGGDIMQAVMERMNNFSRMALCGMISEYDTLDKITGPKAWPRILMSRIKVQGFIVSDYMDEFGTAMEELVPWALEGKIKTREDVREGLENALDVVRDLYKGGNQGKLLLKV
ncbi:MAG: NADP-dependent oxidoreductase [Pseudomonadota bacterium]